MPARVAISTTGQNGQYVGTTRVPTPTATPGSPTCRNFNGLGDRLLLGPSNNLGANYLVVMTFWRGDGSVLPNNRTAARLFTQYCVGGTRVAVGLNENNLSITFTTASGQVQSAQSRFQLTDVQQHFLGLLVQTDKITVYLDGRVALEVTTSLASPDLARVCVGADTSQRYFKGQIDDLAVYSAVPGKTPHWLRYYRALVKEQYPRDYLSTQFANGYNAVELSEDGFSAAGFSDLARVPVSQPFRDDDTLPRQFLEFSFIFGAGQLILGVFNGDHNLETDELGSTDNSYGLHTDGNLYKGGVPVAVGFGSWGDDDVLALGWEPASRTLSFWINGTHVSELVLPAGTWTAAASISNHTIQMNSGDSVPRSLPTDTPGLPAKLWSKLTTEFRHMRLGELSTPLDEPDSILRDARTDLQMGEYTAPFVTGAGFTDDPYDISRERGGGIRVSLGTYTAADDNFFFSIAFSPAEADLTGETVILESPGKWGIRILDGKLNAWVGSVQVGSVNAPFTAGERYLIGITRSAAGKLMVWTQLGYILQSGDTTVAQTATDVFVGSAADGSDPFTGQLSHLVLASKQPAAWKLNRLRSVYTWDVPDVEGVIPNPAEVREVFEVSWRDVIAEGINPTPLAASCYVGTLAEKPDDIAIEYRPVDRKGANAFTGSNIESWCPGTTLLQLMSVSSTQVALAGTTGLEGVLVGDPVLIGGEICRVTDLNLQAAVMEVARGCVDTVPLEHGAGSKIWFYKSVMGSSANIYQSLDNVDVKILSRSALVEMGEEFAPIDVVAMQGRLARPYPPADLLINEEQYPESLAGTVYIQWRHRNKSAQAVALVGYREGDYTAPAGVSYIVRAYNATTSELLHESSAVAGTDSDYNLLVEGYTGPLTVTVTSYEGALACLNVPRLQFEYTDEVTVLITTEEDEAFGTEDEGVIETEALTAMRAASYSGEDPDDWGGLDDFEEEEEEEEGMLIDGQIIGVKVSEMPPLLLSPTGEEFFPIISNGINYQLTFEQFAQYLIAIAPQPADGKSAYQTWLELGNTGSEADFIASLVGPQGLNSNQARRIQTVTSASGALICNWADFDEIRLRLTGPVTLSFTGPRDGQGCLLKLEQAGLGGHTVTLPASVRYNALVQQYTPTPTPGLVDKIGFIYDSGDSTYDFVTFIPGITTP